MFGFGKNGKEKQARQQLSDLGLDPSLFDDPEFSDDEPEVGSDAYIESFASETIPVAKPPDVSHLLGGGGDDDSDVELDEQDLADDSELSRSLANLMLEDDDDAEIDPDKLPLGKRIARLEEELLETKRAAIFFRQQDLMQEARDQLVLIKELNEKLDHLRAQDPNYKPQKPTPPPTKVSERSQETVTPSKKPDPVIVEKPSASEPMAFGSSSQPGSGLYQFPGMALSPIAPQVLSTPEAPSPVMSSSPLELSSFTSVSEEHSVDTPPEISPSPSPPLSEDRSQNSPPATPSPVEARSPPTASSVPNLSVTDEELEAELSELGDTNPSDSIAQKILICEKEKALCMAKAIELKNEDRKVEAIQWLRSAKLFQSALQMLQGGEDVDLDAMMQQAPTHQGQVSSRISSPSRPPASPEVATSPKPSAPPPKQEMKKEPASEPKKETSAVPQLNEAERKRILSFMALEKALSAQSEKWKEYALSHKAAGELPLAVKYHNERKGMLDDLKQLKEAKDVPGMPLPEFSKEKYTHVREIHFRNRLEADELEVAVVQASNIKVPSGYVTVDSYVAVTCPCASDEPLWKTHKESANNSPVFKEVHRYKFERNKRTLLKVLERKKIVFELFHSRWLRGDISLGKCELSLSDIKTKAEIKEELPILVAGRKSKGTLSVRVRVCYPLQQKHLVQEDEEIVVIRRHHPLSTAHSQPSIPLSQPEPTKNTGTPSPATPAPPKAQQTISAPVVSKPAPAQPAPAPVVNPTPPKPVSTNPSPAVEPDEEEDFNPVENMMSNDVLEWGLELIEKEIAQYQTKGQPIPEELITKKQQIDLKMQLLIIQIQTGKMSEEEYVAQVQQKITDEKALARKYMSAKNQQGARLALTRAKIMTTELEGEE